MPIKKITAIIDELQWVKVEKALEVHGVTGFTVHAVKGRGNYSNTYSKDHLVDHVQIVIYTGDKPCPPYCNINYADGRCWCRE
ncbi:P-II family nitrogen regulator [Cycloclasticus zancles]|uniref:Nitrogen regulatory protein PII n=1 Tax=Cycloclasticus zancles 78-ME TaxID=1198232 RepID=S5TFM3_9GAMM|nr:P-II family nitrogen regulator [Cycloclasticus zancles]AGS39647.1 Nitrogen regulatory protein PII [Cycloclasticus zancles 78-ME]